MAAVLHFATDEAADVLRGAKTSLLKLSGDPDYTQHLGINEGAILNGETAEGGQFCELRVSAVRRGPLATLQDEIEELRSRERVGGSDELEVLQLRFELTKVLSSVTVESKQFWGAMAAADIPSKKTLHWSFMDAVSSVWKRPGGGSVLDLGCGDGRIAVELIGEAEAAGGRLDLVGVDVCGDGVEAARRRAAEASLAEVEEMRGESADGEGRGGSPSRASFCTADITALRLPRSFDLVLCQLVLSVVGGLDQRKGLLESAARHLKAGGQLLLSISGASEEVNAKYAAQYEADLPVTGEYRTYLSRGSGGEVLYVTHHFTVSEAEALIAQAGLEQVRTVVEEEASSRRPDEKAIFLYTSALKPLPST